MFRGDFSRKEFISLDKFKLLINDTPDSDLQRLPRKVRHEIEKWGTDNNSKLKEYQPQ